MPSVKQGSISTANLFVSECERVFGINPQIDANLRGNEFWALRLNSSKKRFEDIFGNVPKQSLAAIQNRGYFDVDAGYKVNAQKDVAIGKTADIFMINIDHVKRKDLSPLLIHEGCHFIEDAGHSSKFKPSTLDTENGKVLISAYASNALKWHSHTWASLLCWAARQERDCGNSKSIRQFIEDAVPSYDRPNWNGAHIGES